MIHLAKYLPGPDLVSLLSVNKTCRRLSGQDSVRSTLLQYLRSDNNRALVNACLRGLLTSVQYLRSCGLTLADVRSSNALYHASKNEHLSVIKYLLSWGLTLGDLRTDPIAHTNNNLTVIKFLRNVECPLDTIQTMEQYAALLALINESLEMILLLVVAKFYQR